MNNCGNGGWCFILVLFILIAIIGCGCCGGGCGNTCCNPCGGYGGGNNWF
ncbi:MAG: sporulation protein YjcZ [Bacilli bacterium]|nr:sporulation protein YjcZ [Bacilli bacterium]